MEQHIYSHRAIHTVARHLLKHDEVLQSLPELEHMLSAVGLGHPAKTPGGGRDDVVCIVGAGVAGLYTAMMFQSLNIKFEIMEAEHRVGGRLYTYKFPGSLWDQYEYYDVGAMRFPDTKFMWRTFDLARNRGLDVNLIPYKFAAGNTHLRFNGITITRDKDGNIPRETDPFNIEGSSTGNYVTRPFLLPGEPWNYLKHYLDPMRAPFKNPNVDIQQELNNLYQRWDRYSTRSWFFSQTQYTTGDIHYLETIGGSTGYFDKAFTEDVIDSLAFDWPDPNEGAWYCFDKGSSSLPWAMLDKLKLPYPALQYDTVVTSINPADPNNSKSAMNVGFTHTTTGKKVTKGYSAVVTTVPLPCLSTMDLNGCSIEGVNYPQWSGIRELQYGPAIKVGIRFTEAWWENPNVVGKGKEIVGGQSYTDLPIRTIVYPSYPKDGHKSNVLIASYARMQDGERLGSWINSDGSADDRLIDLIFRDLAAVHEISEKTIRGFWKGGKENYYAFDWYHNPFSMGAFAFFGPGEFVDQIYNQVCQPAAEGRLFIAGEATSSCHAWVAGALDSAWRAVYQYLQLHRSDLVDEFKKKWGDSEYWYGPGPKDKKGKENNYAMMEDVLRLSLRHTYFATL